MKALTINPPASQAAAPPEMLDRNLAALRARQPEVAQTIEHCDLPEGLVPAIARDGTPTFLVPRNGCRQGEALADPHRPSAWLGGCSMPQAAAEEMFGHVDAHGGSVLLPAILTGLEAVTVAKRLAPSFAVFIVDDPQRFKVVFSLRDLTAWLESGRMVLLLSDDLPARARQFFSCNPGFAIPVHLFKVPQISAGRLATLARDLEDAGAAAIQTQRQFVSDCVRRLGERPIPPVSQRPKVVIVSADAWAVNEALASSLGRAVDSMGGTCSVCLPTRPETCHVAARIAAVDSAQPEIMISLSVLDALERAMYPAGLPVVQWLRPGSATPYSTALGPYDAVVVSNRNDAELARSSGWSAGQVILAEPAADMPLTEVENQTAIGAESPMAVLMDLPDDRPEVHGVTLPSHLALWQALREECVRRGDSYDEADARRVLDAAQVSSGTTLTDETLRTSFETVIRLHIAPAAVARTAALALLRHGFEPDIYGNNWPRIGKKSDLRKGPIHETCPLASVPAWQVIPWYSHVGVQLAIDALARQSVIFMRGRPAAFAEDYPGLGGLAGAIHWFQTSPQLVSALRELRSRPTAAATQAQIVAQQIRSQHTMANRLIGLFEHVRAAQNPRQTKESPRVERL